MQLFSFQGRAGRAQYFWHSFLDSFVMMALIFGVVYALGFQDMATTGMTATHIIGIVLIIAIVLAGVMSELAVTIRRFHDLGRPGVHYFLTMIPFYNIYIGFMLLFQKGNDGPNNYGTDPLKAA